jgi:hypothetical protein
MLYTNLNVQREVSITMGLPASTFAALHLPRLNSCISRSTSLVAQGEYFRAMPQGTGRKLEAGSSGAKLTDDELTAINGRRDQLEGKMQEQYGYAKDQARQEVDDWYSTQNWYQINRRNQTDHSQVASQDSIPALTS